LDNDEQLLALKVIVEDHPLPRLQLIQAHSKVFASSVLSETRRSEPFF
jgi:hypothetical protein